ncbi:MAG: DUF1566 domain-containing protein [Byssovorax sp.]
MNRTLCLTAIASLLVGCNLLLGTEAPVIRQEGTGGTGTSGVVASVGVGGEGDPISISGPGSGGSATSAAGGATGVCGDGSWAHWPVGGAHEYQIFTGSTLEQSVTDSLTGLDWQRTSSTKSVSWSQADTHCKLLKWADKTGWRLPTRMELLSIVDYSKAWPSVDGVLFPETTSDPYWTSSHSMYLPQPSGTAFWQVSFADGGMFPGMAGSGLGQIRCVRAGAAPASTGSGAACYRYDITDTTARDIETGLTWERASSDQPLLREDAAGRCGKLQIAGKSWRLPTIAELASILDEEKPYAPRLDPGAFPGGGLAEADWYWSSTSDAVKPSAAAWSIRVLNGTVSELSSPGPAYVRCVY